MKIIDRKKVFMITSIIFLFLGFLIKIIFDDITKNHKSFVSESVVPMVIDNSYEVVDYSMNEYEITVYLKNLKTNELYESTLPKDDMEELVCENLFKEFYPELNKEWDCSTEFLKTKSLVHEVATQTIEIIKGE